MIRYTIKISHIFIWASIFYFGQLNRILDLGVLYWWEWDGICSLTLIIENGLNIFVSSKRILMFISAFMTNKLELVLSVKYLSAKRVFRRSRWFCYCYLMLFSTCAGLIRAHKLMTLMMFASTINNGWITFITFKFHVEHLYIYSNNIINTDDNIIYSIF